MTPHHHCPTCGREFKDILDYPRVRILDFARLPIPEAVDSFPGLPPRNAWRDGGQNGLILTLCLAFATTAST